MKILSTKGTGKEVSQCLYFLPVSMLTTKQMFPTWTCGKMLANADLQGE